jgi:hypothetical protein
MAFIDQVKGKETVKLGCSIPIEDNMHYKAHWRIEKFLGDYPGMTAEEIKAAGVQPYEVWEHTGNVLLNGGINSILCPALTGAITSTYVMSATYGCIGVGDSTTAATAAQTGLQASTNRYWMLVTAIPTTGSSQAIVLTATFASGVANYAWAEICAGAAPSGLPGTTAGPPGSGVAFNRLVQAMGTKASGTSWVPTLTITFS